MEGNGEGGKTSLKFEKDYDGEENERDKEKEDGEGGRGPPHSSYRKVCNQ